MINVLRLVENNGISKTFLLALKSQPPNGERYPLVGGTRQRHFAGTNSQSRKLLENAPTPTSRVHAVLGNIPESKNG